MGYGTRSTRIKLQDVDTLTFYNDAQTSYRRTSPVDQLTCKGKICSAYTPEVVQCRNTGGRGNDIQWKCEADLPSSIRLGRVEVSCEGYDHADDDYVLKGSCGLTYTLLSSGSAFEQGRAPQDSAGKASLRQQSSRFASKFVNNLFNAVTFCLVLYLIWVTVAAPLMRYFRRNTPRIASDRNTAGGAAPRPPWGGWPGGSGGSDHRPGFGGGGPGSGWRNPFSPGSSTFGSDASKEQATAGAWRPGFWSGLAAGAAGENLRSRMRNSGAAPAPSRASRAWTTEPSTRYDSPMQDRGEGTSTMGSIRTSTGYGGTRNR